MKANRCTYAYSYISAWLIWKAHHSIGYTALNGKQNSDCYSVPAENDYMLNPTAPNGCGLDHM